MKISAAKAKGRRLCIQAKEIILSVFTELKDDDIRIPATACPGEDLWLSPLAKEKLPIVFEMKNQEKINIWKAITQAQSHSSDGRCPVVVFSRNREPEPYAVIKFKDLIAFIKK